MEISEHRLNGMSTEGHKIESYLQKYYAANPKLYWNTGKVIVDCSNKKRPTLNVNQVLCAETAKIPNMKY